MNTSLVKVAPQGEFAEVSVLTKDWEAKFHALLKQKRPIKFDAYPVATIPQEINSRLDQQGYHDFILADDRWQHFLVTNSIETPSDRVSNKVSDPSLVATGLFGMGR